MRKMKKREFLEQYFDLIPRTSLISKMSQRLNDTKEYIKTRSHHSLSEPLHHSLPKKNGHSKYSSLSTSDLQSLNEMQSVEVVLTNLFESSGTEDYDINAHSRISENSRKSSTSLDDLIMDLDSSDENPELSNSKIMNSPKKENLNDTQLQWGNTYPINTPDKCDTAEIIISADKISQSQEISTTNHSDVSPEKDTQMVWEDMFQKFNSNQTSNEERPQQEMSIEKDNESTLQERNRNAPENEGTFHITKQQESTIANNFSDEELLQYLCYHSFELLDFKNDEIWYQLGLNKNFNKESCQFYKQRFFNHIIKCADSYHIPSYFSSYLKKNYNDNKSFTPNKSMKGTTISLSSNKTSCYPRSKQTTRKNESDEHSVIHDEDISTEPLSCSCKTKFSSSSEMKSKKIGSYLSKNSTNRSQFENQNKHDKKRRKMASQLMFSESSEESDGSIDDCNPFKKCAKLSLLGNKPTLSESIKPKAKHSERNFQRTQSKNHVAETSHLQIKPKGDTKFNIENSLSSDSDGPLSPVIFPADQSQSKLKIKSGTLSCSGTADHFLATPSPSTPILKLKYTQSRTIYMHHEKQKILDYLQSKSAFLDTIKGNLFWKEMEASGVVPDRSWQSLKNHFFKSLVHDLSQYSLNPPFEAKLKRYSQRVSK